MAKEKSWDFWSSKKMSYEGRNKIGAGDNYGLGEKPKTGSMRETYMGSAKTKGMAKPPKKLG